MSKLTEKRLIILIIIAIFAVSVGGYAWYHKKGSSAPPTTAVVKTDEPVDDNAVPEQPIIFTNSGPAPEFVGLSNWLNTGEPAVVAPTPAPTVTSKTKKIAKAPPDPVAPGITMASLKDKVVLVNFWTYSCIDCTKLVPYISKWGKDYGDKGLVVIGIHTPQFAFEKVAANYTNAVKAQKITYPVAQDNDYKSWSAYHTQFWPTTYLIDKSGTIVYTQIGGGKYGQTEKAIRTLLGLEDSYQTPGALTVDNSSRTDMNAGLAKTTAFGGVEKPYSDEQVFTFPKKLAKNKFALEGLWKFDQESVIHTKGYARLYYNFTASQAFIIASSPDPITIKVYIDEKLAKGVIIKDRDVYQLFDSLTPGDHTIRLEIPDQTLQIYSFTFN